MKLIIDIPEEVYKAYCASTYCINDMIILENEVRNGTPLDDVKAEIKEKLDKINYIVSDLPYPKHRAIQELLCEILESIDKAESEEDKVKDFLNQSLEDAIDCS